MFKGFFTRKENNKTFSLYSIKYFVYGDIKNTYEIKISAKSPDEAKTMFWESHNYLYHDIESINIVKK